MWLFLHGHHNFYFFIFRGTKLEMPILTISRNSHRKKSAVALVDMGSSSQTQNTNSSIMANGQPCLNQ